MLYKSPIRIDEGKQQAIQILKGTYSDGTIKLIINKLSALDPTAPKNKYLELLAKSFKGFDNQIKNLVSTRDTLYNLKFFVDKCKNLSIPEKLEDVETRQLTVDFKKAIDLVTLSVHLDAVTSIKTKSTKKSGLLKLKVNKDYIEIPLDDVNIKAYIPLNWEASKILASLRVGNCEGKWCTAYGKDDSYWRQYIFVRNGILVYIVNLDDSEDKYQIREGKQAILFTSSGLKFEGWTSNDVSINNNNKLYEFKTIQVYIKKNWNKIREKLEGNVDKTPFI